MASSRRFTDCGSRWNQDTKLNDVGHETVRSDVISFANGKVGYHESSMHGCTNKFQGTLGWRDGVAMNIHRREGDEFVCFVTSN